MWERARAVEGSLGEVVGMCQGCIPEVFWTGEEVKADVLAEQDYRPVGGDAVLQESINATGKRKEPPPVAAFEKLSLLGT